MEEERTEAAPARRLDLRARLEEVLDVTGSTALAVLGGAAALGVVLGALWWVSRQAPAPVESLLPVVDPTSITTTTAEPPPLVVHVAGAVRDPGVRRLPAGSRIVDAVRAAGGATPDADLDQLNLAAPLSDGVRIYVPVEGEVVASPGATEGATDPAGPIDLNTAGAALLETLPGVGPATAAAIIDHRQRHGPFRSVEGLLAVRGIGEAKLAALRDLVRV